MNWRFCDFQVMAPACRAIATWALVLSIVLPSSVGQALARNESQTVRIVAFGDSLTAGYGLDLSASFPSQLEKALKARGHNVAVGNAGVSGDTTAAGLERFDWAVPDVADAVILELGANDALRGIDPAVARANLDKILSRIKARNIPVIVAGMNAPANWGKDYADAFGTMFEALAKKYDALYYPFFLEGVALDPKLNLPDGLHPNAKGVKKIVEGMLPIVEQLIARAKAAKD